MANLKTTLCGLAVAIALAIQNYNGHNGWKGYAVAAGVAALGYFSADAKK